MVVWSFSVVGLYVFEWVSFKVVFLCMYAADGLVFHVEHCHALVGLFF